MARIILQSPPTTDWKLFMHGLRKHISNTKFCMIRQTIELSTDLITSILPDSPKQLNRFIGMIYNRLRTCEYMRVLLKCLWLQNYHDCRTNKRFFRK